MSPIIHTVLRAGKLQRHASPECSLLLCLLVGKPLAPVICVDDPALSETVLFEKVLHDVVIPVGIDLKVAALAEGPVQAEGSGSLHGPV